VIESRAHADARGAKRIARLTTVLSDRSKRQPGDIGAALGRLWSKISSRLKPGKAAVISGATGTAPATQPRSAPSSRSTQDIAVRAPRHLCRTCFRAAVFR